MLPGNDLRMTPALVAAIVGALCWAGFAYAQDEYAGSETCAVCHEDTALAFALTAHARAPNWDAESGCESCHGPGSAHAESGGEIELIVRPRSVTPPHEASGICLSCHERQERHFTARHSVHSLSEVSCLNCHSVHSTAEHLLERQGVDLCQECHQTIVSQFELPRAHPLDGYSKYATAPRTGKACANCHEPHTTNSLSNTRGFWNRVCNECHFEKAGPFVYGHDVSLVDDCRACHRVHGSPNRHLLTHSRQVNLCYQCHPGTTTPVFHNASGFINEKCSACHTAIHGSNTNPLFLEE